MQKGSACDNTMLRAACVWWYIVVDCNLTGPWTLAGPCFLHSGPPCENNSKSTDDDGSNAACCIDKGAVYGQFEKLIGCTKTKILSNDLRACKGGWIGLNRLRVRPMMWLLVMLSILRCLTLRRKLWPPSVYHCLCQ